MSDFDNYECTLLSPDGNRWSMEFKAGSFQHALSQCAAAMPANDSSILISVNKDYDPKKEWPEDDN